MLQPYMRYRLILSHHEHPGLYFVELCTCTCMLCFYDIDNTDLCSLPLILGNADYEVAIIEVSYALEQGPTAPHPCPPLPPIHALHSNTSTYPSTSDQVVLSLTAKQDDILKVA